MAMTSVPGPGVSRSVQPIVVIVASLLLAGAIATAATGWAIANSPIFSDRGTDAVWRSLFVASFIAGGTYMVWRRPENRMGWLVVVVGFATSAIALDASGNPLVYTLGIVVWAVVNVLLSVYAILCFPRGRLESTLERSFVIVVVAVTAVALGLILALSPTLPMGGPFGVCGARCPGNALQLVSGHAETGAALLTTFNIITTIQSIGLAMLVFSKARSPVNLRRRLILPVAVVFIVNTMVFVTALYLTSVYPGTVGVLRLAFGLTTIAIPLALVAGQVRGDVFAATRLSRIAVRAGVERPTPANIERVIADALGDASLRLALWSDAEAAYVAVDGERATLPVNANERAVTRISRDGRPVAALIHDPTLDVDTGVVEGLAATSMMLLENARLVDELRASRSRLVQSGERERRRLERDLHDGAQQRLMAIQIKLSLAQGQIDDGPLVQQLRSIADEAVEAVEELRTLAHGIYPAALAAGGLPDALRVVALRAPTPVRVISDAIGRLPGAVEAAVYYCALEAIQNATKHAGKGAEVTVALRRRDGDLLFEIADDGAGFEPASRTDGFGLVSMRDRIGAVGGDLQISSEPGSGTVVRGIVALDQIGDGWSVADDAEGPR